MHTIRILAATAALALLSGCATSHVLTGTPRAPIDPTLVQIYHGPPPGAYQEIAVLNTSSGALTYGEQNKVDAVLRNLREEAARLGANGVLLEGLGEGYGNTGVSVGVGGGSIGRSSFSTGGVGLNVSPSRKQASGIAIYVIDPPPN